MNKLMPLWAVALLLASCGTAPVPSAVAQDQAQGTVQALRGGGGGGGSGSGSGVGSGSALPITAGPCDPNVFSQNLPNRTVLAHTPLDDPRYPGVNSVDVIVDVSGAGLPMTISNVCLAPDWTVTSTAVKSGAQLRFYYQGVKAIDFTYIPGKTEIRHL